MTPTYQSGFYAPGRGTAKYPELWRGCVGAWNPGLGNSGLVLRDWSGKGNHGILTGGPTWGVVSGHTALSLDNVDDRVYAANINAIRNSDFTISLWWSPNSISGFHGITSQWSGSGTGAIAFSTNDTIAWQIGFSRYTSPAILVAGTMYNLTLTLSQLTYAVWVNGAYVGSFSNGGANDASQPFEVFGTNNSGGTEYANAKFISSHVMNRCLSTNEIRLLATRPGIAYELAPRKVYSLPPTSTPHIQYFSGSAARNGSIITGASPLGIVSKVQKSGNLITIPEDRFDDPKYYRS